MNDVNDSDSNQTNEAKEMLLELLQSEIEVDPTQFQQWAGDASKFLDSYKNAIKELTKKSQELAALKKETPKPMNQSAEPTPTPSSDPSFPLITKKETPAQPVPFEKLTEIYVQNGGRLPDDVKERLTKNHNLSADAIVALESNLKTAVVANTERLANAIGGKENLNKLLTLLSEKLSPQEAAGINQALMGPAGVATLVGLYQQFFGSAPNSTSKPINSSVNVPAQNGNMTQALEFQNERQILEIMKDPRYGQSIEFDQQVRNAINKFYAKRK